jgi:drug/metabolite transporter (DMT)-like permease
VSDTIRGIGFALAAALVYGLAPPFTRLAFDNGVPAMESTTWRTFALIVLFTIFVASRRVSLRVPKGAGSMLVLMCLSTSMISIGYLGSVQFVPVALAVIIFFTFPITILLLSPLIEGRKLSVLRLAIGSVAFTGLVLAIGPEFKQLDPVGLALAGVASCGATMQFFSGRILSHYMQPVAFGLIAHAALLPVVVAIVLCLGGGKFASFAEPETIMTAGWIALAVVALTYALGYLCHMMSVKSAPASVVAPFFNLEPVTSITAAVIVLAEIPGTNQLVGGALVLAALIAAGLAGTRQQTQN